MAIIMKPSSELKAIAKESLKGNYGSAIYALLLFIVVSIVPLCAPAMQVGYIKFSNKLVRKENADASSVFEGLELFGKSLWLYILIGIFTYLWSILFLIPGIIKALSYSMAPYILADNPEMTAREALSVSKELMYGKKSDLFYIILSFIGWIILGYFTLGIAFLWIAPYMQTTMAAFYNDAIGVSFYE